MPWRPDEFGQLSRALCEEVHLLLRIFVRHCASQAQGRRPLRRSPDFRRHTCGDAFSCVFTHVPPRSSPSGPSCTDFSSFEPDSFGNPPWGARTTWQKHVLPRPASVWPPCISRLSAQRPSSEVHRLVSRLTRNERIREIVCILAQGHDAACR